MCHPKLDRDQGASPHAVAVESSTGARRSVRELCALYEPTLMLQAAPAATATTAVHPAPAPATPKSATPAPAPIEGSLPPFDDAMVIVAVALFHWLVCLGFHVAAIISHVLVPIATRVAMGLCGIARCAQQLHAMLPLWNEQPPTATTTSRKSKTDLVPKTTTTTATATTPTVPTTTRPTGPVKVSPAVRQTIPRGRAVCTLYWSSHNVCPIQRAATDRARHILHDAHVVFEELDTACMLPASQEVIVQRLRQCGAPAGVYPQVLVETSQAPDWSTPKAQHQKKKPMYEVRRLSIDKLETVDYYADVPLPELVQLDAVSKSALFLFQDAPTRRLPSHTFAAQLRALGAAIVLHDEALFPAQYASWRVTVDMDWTQYMFEDAWDVFTAIKLYSLMP